MDELFYFTFDLFTKFLRMQKFTLKPFVMFHFGFLLNPLLLDVSGSRRSRCDSSAVAESCVFKPAHPPGKGGDDLSCMAIWSSVRTWQRQRNEKSLSCPSPASTVTCYDLHILFLMTFFGEI